MPEAVQSEIAELRFGAEEVDEARVNDLIAQGALRKLREFGALPAGDPVYWPDYHLAAERITGSFEVEVSSITTRMSRLLYGITAAVAPRSIVCVGSAWGNALAWLAAAAPDAHVLGIDIDADATAVAVANFRRAGLRADFLVADGRSLDVLRGNRFDLVLLDADDPDTGKGLLRELLAPLEPLLAPAAVVLAHDSCHPKFADDFVAYRQAVRDVLGARVTVNMPIDWCGLEITAL